MSTRGFTPGRSSDVLDGLGIVTLATLLEWSWQPRLDAAWPRPHDSGIAEADRKDDCEDKIEPSYECRTGKRYDGTVGTNEVGDREADQRVGEYCLSKEAQH